MAASDSGASLGISEAENCSDIRLLLSALVDGEVSPEEASRVKSHILTCPNCASHLAFLRLTGRALSQVPEMFPSPSLSARIAAATYERPTLAERIAGWLRPAPVRVALGTVMAAGLTLVIIMPRMGGEVATNIPPSGGTKAAPLTKKPAEKNIASKSVARAGASVGVEKPAVIAETESLPEPESLPDTVLPPVQPAAKTSLATAPAPILTPRKPAPVKVALANLNAGKILPLTRTDPPMDRHSSLRSSANMRLKTPGAGGMTIPRSGYDRAAVTEPMMKPREAASSAPTLPTASGVTPSLSPLPSENTTVKIADPGSGSAERIASRPTPATTAATVASAAEVQTAPAGKKMRFRLNGTRPSNTETLSISGASSQGGSLGANDPYSFGNGNAVHIGIASAPVK